MANIINTALTVINEITSGNLQALENTILDAAAIDPDISFLTNTVLSIDAAITSIDDQIDVGNVALTYAQADNIYLNQGVTSTIYNPVNTSISSTANTLLFASSLANTVTGIAATQPTDITHTPIGIEPPMAFQGQYPYVHTHKTESGHIIEHDDTPGNERIFQYHKSGTYQEIGPTGRRVNKINDDNITVVVNDDKVHVEGSGYLYVKGNITVICLNDVNLQVAGRVEMVASEDIRIKGSSIYIESTGGDINMYSAGNINTLSESDTNMTTQGNFNALSSGNMTHISEDNLYLQSSGDTNLNSSGKANIQSGSDTNINSSGSFNSLSAGSYNIDGSSLQIQDGTGAGSAATGITAIPALTTGLPPGPVREGTVPSVAESIIQGLDDDFDVRSQELNKGVASGRITPQQYNNMTQTPPQAAAPDTASAPTNLTPLTTSVADILSLPDSAISPSLRLSQNYRVSDFTTTPTFKYPLIPWNGRTKARLAGNLALLAQNCVEPIAAKWGPININSGFRSQTGKSQHAMGMACDITYGLKSTDPASILEIAQWIRDHILFDQLIIEYGTSQIWTHVSYNGETGKQRQMLLTCPAPAANQYLPGLIQYSWTPNAN